MKKINTRAITLAATLVALCCVTGFLPYVFFLPVMVAATTLSIGMVAFVGLAFGAVSVAYSFLMPVSPVALAFIQAPYIAIFPRIAAALGAFGIYKLIQKFGKPAKKPARFAAVAGSAAIGSLLNTALVVSLFVLVMPDVAALIAYVPTMLISGAIECVCMAVVTPPISMTLEKVVLRGKRAQKNALMASPVPDSEHAVDIPLAQPNGDNSTSDSPAEGGEASASDAATDGEQNK